MTSSTTRTAAQPAARPSSRTTSRVAAALGAAALAAALAACSSPAGDQPMGGTSGTSRSASPSAATEDHNGADVTFAQQMVVHHEGAIAMADLAADRAADQRVTDLAARIRAAQAPEVEQMTGWLQAWGEPAPDPSASPASGMDGMRGMDATDHSSGSMDHSAGDGAMGMMSQQELDQLSAASGAAFDRMFLQMMVVHHQGAVEMAQQEEASGTSSDATALAASVVTSQTAEISEMQQLLTELG